MTQVVRAVARATEILELFLDGSQDLTAAEITRHLGLPRTTVHELVKTLVALEYLAATTEQPQRYRLGVRTLQLGSMYAQQLDLTREGQIVAQQVAGACDETVHLATLDGPDVTYVVKVDSTHSVRMVSAVGHRLPAHCTGVGKMLLSSLSDEALQARFSGQTTLPTMTPNSIATMSDLKDVLAQIRERGVATDEGESSPAVSCVAAPVYDRDDRMVAAMSISAPTFRWNPELQDRFTKLVTDGAEELSIQLGHVRQAHRKR